MAIRFVDSFDHYANTNISQKWTTFVSLTTATGRHGLGLSGLGGMTKTLDFQPTWTVGFAMKGGGKNIGAANMYVLEALVGVGNLDTVLSIRHNEDSSVSIVTGNNTVLGVSPAYDWSGYHFIEAHITMSGTSTMTVTATLRVNTETIFTGSGPCNITIADLANGGTAGANVHLFSPADLGTIDDLYITDGQGGANTSYLGDVLIKVIRPNGDNITNWTGTTTGTATTHYTDVNEIPPDDDSSYVFSTATGSAELYDWEDISSFIGTIKGVQYSVYARKDEEGARVIQLLEGTTGTNTITSASGKVDIYLNDNYDYHHVAMDTSPTTGTAWTVSDFNSDRFGYKVGTNT